MLMNTRGVAQAHFNTGLAFQQKGQQPLAQEAYAQALKLQADHFEALHLLGVIGTDKKTLLGSWGRLTTRLLQ